MAVAVAGDRGLLRITARRLCATGVARARQNFVELAFEHGLQEFTRSIPKASFDRIEPVVEKVLRRLDFRLRQARGRDIACHGVISAGASTPESLVASSWRLRRLHFPTTPATAPAGMVPPSPAPFTPSGLSGFMVAPWDASDRFERVFAGNWAV